MLRKTILSALLSLCVLFGSPVLANTSNEGPKHLNALQAYKESKFSEAANLWLADAYAGHAEAQYRAAIALLTGEGVAKNHYEALYWLRRSSEAGYTKSQLLLGKLLVESGEKSNIKEGIDWWLKAAKAGNKEAQFNYAMALDQGIGVPKDRAGARQWLRRSIKAGSLQAQYYLNLSTQESEKSRAQEKPKKAKKAKKTTDKEVVNPSKVNNQQAGQAVTQKTKGEKAKKNGDVAEGDIARVRVPNAVLYNHPNTDGRVLFNLTQGILVRVLGTYSDWVKVSTPGGLPSWIKKKYTGKTPDGKYVTKKTEWVYSSPGKTTRDRYARVPKNHKFTVIGQSGDWYKTRAPYWVGAWMPLTDLTQLKQSDALSLEWQKQKKQLSQATF